LKSLNQAPQLMLLHTVANSSNSDRIKASRWQKKMGKRIKAFDISQVKWNLVKEENRKRDVENFLFPKAATCSVWNIKTAPVIGSGKASLTEKYLKLRKSGLPSGLQRVKFGSATSTYYLTMEIK